MTHRSQVAGPSGEWAQLGALIRCAHAPKTLDEGHSNESVRNARGRSMKQQVARTEAQVWSSMKPGTRDIRRLPPGPFASDCVSATLAETSGEEPHIGPRAAHMWPGMN